MFNIVNQQCKLDIGSRANEPIIWNTLDNTSDWPITFWNLNEHIWGLNHLLDNALWRIECVHGKHIRCTSNCTHCEFITFGPIDFYCMLSATTAGSYLRDPCRHACTQVFDIIMIGRTQQQWHHQEMSKRSVRHITILSITREYQHWLRLLLRSIPTVWKHILNTCVNSSQRLHKHHTINSRICLCMDHDI